MKLALYSNDSTEFYLNEPVVELEDWIDVAAEINEETKAVKQDG